ARQPEHHNHVKKLDPPHRCPCLAVPTSVRWSDQGRVRRVGVANTTPAIVPPPTKRQCRTTTSVENVLPGRSGLCQPAQSASPAGHQGCGIDSQRDRGRAPASRVRRNRVHDLENGHEARTPTINPRTVDKNGPTTR